MSSNKLHPSFRDSRWFKRGWTLQELIAPRSVDFLSRNGRFLGNKETLEQEIHEITKIPVAALRGAPLSHFAVGERMRWADERETTKKEDKAYCLLGIFDVSMTLRYGEGEKAFTRLERKIYASSKGRETLPLLVGHSFAKTAADPMLMAWLAPARPEETQVKVSASRHPDTGSSFATGPLSTWLRDEDGWKSLMWMTGKCEFLSPSLFSLVAGSR
jgi:hypothetical protein